MAHVKLVAHPRGIVRKLAFGYTRRNFGHVVEPTAAAANHAGVLAAWGAMEMLAARSWKKIDPALRGLVVQLVSTRIGCPWCIDYGYFETVEQGTSPEKVRNVSNWRDSDVFDDRERAAFEYAEIATGSPAEVPGDVAERLRRHFGEAEIVELAAWVALENYRSRFNAGLGLKSEGFSDRCEIPLAAARTAGSAG
jgi:alkylhydroperoxidase family enzyme